MGLRSLEVLHINQPPAIECRFVNDWTTVLSCAHLYNACQGEKRFTKEWNDMELLFSLYGSEAFFMAYGLYEA
jgi:hypothetical protein